MTRRDAVRFVLACALLPAGVAALSAPATDEPITLQAGSQKLTPGGTLTVAFPDLPPTLYDALNGATVKPQMTVFLPRNYDSARKHPLLIFLNGGDGGTGGNPGVARALSQETDFVCVGLPLFRKDVIPAAPGNNIARMLVKDTDGQYAWPLYRTMLAKLEQMVPNIDPANRILGGFSNGAHTTAALINQSDGEVARRFSAFFLVDGGGGLQRYDLLKGKPLLMVCGRWRPNPEPGRAAGVKLAIYRMKNPVHAFPESEYPVVRQWLRAPGEAALPQAPAEESAGLKVGDRAPDFRLTANGGKEVSLAQFRGKSAVALCWFLRAGSSGSRAELSAIQAEMSALSRYRVQVLGVTLSKAEAIASFAKELSLTFPLLSDASLATARAYGTVRSMEGAFGPVAERWVFLVDADGVIRSIEKGEDVANKGKLLLDALEKARIPMR